MLNKPKIHKAFIVLCMLLNLTFFGGSAELDRVKTPIKLAFDRDTVIVWTGENQGYSYDFIVRLATWEPKRFFEWENKTTQGTVLLETKALRSSRRFTSSKLFDGGVDAKASDETTLWLSREIFNELMENGKAKLKLDGFDTVFTLQGQDRIETKLNQEDVLVPAIRVKDTRNGEWWFHDNVENPILVKYKIRSFTQTIRSITTNKKNTLRWIKESKIRSVQR